LSAALTLFISYGGRPGTFFLTLVGLASFVVAVVVTVAVEVPIAKQINTWTTSRLPGSWQQLRDRWASVHIIRVITGIGGLALLVAGAIH
jgi:uncharacterized membrane protein